ncbi:ribonuclease P protein component [Nocardioides alcanivorans]|uniref:ribonuclease P protein component n=1 Tax=Nocardioides alcanivorans TaxID=2897352 RepID=UPI002012094C|nr:ribonuclease P protein component [Nocardioides alcanivorans]
MLPKRSRLHTAHEFRAVTRQGRRAGSATLVAHLLVDPDGGPRRAGFVVSRAVGNSVVRNRVRRRLRHLVREHLSVLPDSGMLVVRALPASAAATSVQLEADLLKAIGRVTS